MCMKNSAITFAFVIAIGICFGVNCSHALCRLVRETSRQREMTTAFGETTQNFNNAIRHSHHVR